MLKLTRCNLPFDDRRGSMPSRSHSGFEICQISNEAWPSLFRIIKPGGKLVVLEFSSPVVPGFQTAFQFLFLHEFLPRIGGLVSGSRAAYTYLPDSVSQISRSENAWQDCFKRTGFADVKLPKSHRRHRRDPYRNEAVRFVRPRIYVRI